MQDQEHIYEKPDQINADPQNTHTDPREQIQQPEEAFRPYSEGYEGPRNYDIWREGEKLRPEPENRNKKSMNWLLSLALLVCLIFIVGGILGAIVIWLSWLIVTLLIIAAVAAFIMNWRVVDFPLPERRFQVAEQTSLELSNAGGRVAIRRGEPGVITVNATRRASGFGINPEQMQVSYEQNDRGLAISTRVHWHLFQFGVRNIHFEITVPENCDVQLKNGSGAVIVQGTSGDIRLRTGSGTIEANDLQGQIDLKTGSGRIQASNLRGRIDVVTGSGRIESYGLRGQVALKTGSGGIRIAQSLLAGSSRITTGSGGITYEGALDPQGNALLKTGSGRIVLTLPGDAAFSLDAKTGSGGVSNAFGTRETGRGPRAQLKLRTGSGGIQIVRRGAY